MQGNGGEGKNLLGCGALKWYDTNSGRVRFPNDEVTQGERYWARRKSEYSVQEKHFCASHIPGLFKGLPIPANFPVHSHLWVSPNQSNLHANYTLHATEGVCLGGFPTYPPRPNSNVTSSMGPCKTPPT